MTHESFKQILTFCENYNKEQVGKFLDDSFECPVLEQWFELWKQGKQRDIFEQIKEMNGLRENTTKNDPERIPKDFDLPRKKENRNHEKLTKPKGLKIK